MSVAEAVQTTAKATSSSSSGFVLQRKCACGGSAGLTGECATCRTNKLLGKPLQAKLRVSAPSDEYEQEADRMAEEVMRMPDGLADPGGSPTSTVPLVQGRVNGVGATGFSTAPQIVHDVLNSPGQPLDAATRTFFEPRFGHDLAHVRVHNDGRAQLAAESVHARAFTVGPHIVFGAGEYVPKSIASRQLLAHEVTHAIQQTGGHVPLNVTQSPGSVANTISPTHSASVIARKASPAFPQGDHVADQSVTPSTMRPSVVASTVGLDQSAVAVAEEVIGAQVDALFGEQAATDTDESGRLSTTLTHDRREDEDEEIAIEEITSIQAKSSIPGEGEQPNQPAEEISEPKGIAFGPAASSMTSGSAYEPATASIALAMPITSPSETGRWFNGLPLTVQAEHYEQLGVALSGSLVHQAVETQEGIPELSASLEGVSELPVTPDIVTPPSTPSVAGQALANAPEPLVNIPQAPAQQAVSAPALPTVQSAEPEALARSLGTIEQAPAIVTTLETHEIPLEGKADPAALEKLESAAEGESARALDAAQAGVMDISPETVQPLALDEIVGPPALAEVSVPEPRPQVEGMDKLAGYGLSSRDRAIVDAQLGPSMQEQTAGAQAELEQHERAFDQERARLHLEADAETEAAQAEAEEQQRLEIERGREDLAVQQERTLEQQQVAVNGALGQLAASQQENRQAIDDRLADDRALVDEAYAAAKVDANAKVEEGKAEADAVKRGTIDKVEGSSWWDWAIDTWQALVQTVAAAVVAIGQRIVKEVAGIFDKTIAFATQVVNGAVAFIKNALSAYYDFWIGLVDRLLGDIFPGFAAAFRQAVESLKAKVFEALDTVAATYLQTLRVVADTLVAGLNAGLEAYKAGVAAYVALWEAIQNGQWAEVGKTVLTPILRAAGIDPEEFFATFWKIDEVIDDVIANPGLVGQNAVAALGLGFKQFGTNFIGNFTVAFVEWITGTARIRLPETFGIAGIFQVVCDVLNLTKDYLRKKAVQHLGEGAVTAVEELTELAWATVSGGWAGLWDLVKGKLTTLVDDVVVATGTWLVEKAILVAGRWIAGLAATMGLSVILEALIALWQFVMWLKDQFQRFWMIVKSTVDSVHDFVKGKIGDAANKVEGTLQDLIVPAIDLVAKLLNISNIAKRVEQIIEAVRGVIDRAIDGVILSLKRKLKAGVKTVKQKATALGGKLLNWWNAKSDFKDQSDELHTLFYKVDGNEVKLYVASSNPSLIVPFLKNRLAMFDKDPKPKNYTKSEVVTALDYYRNTVKKREDRLEEADIGKQREKQDRPVRQNESLVNSLEEALTVLGDHLRKLFDPMVAEDFPPPRLPVMADNVQAKSLSADYIVAGTTANGYKYKVEPGTEASEHGGRLAGWGEIVTAGFTKVSRYKQLGRKRAYVKMHLLPHRLGGDAVDSNLTPAPGEVNLAFSSSVEQPAIKASTEGVAKNRRPIWYTFDISYYPGGMPKPNSWRNESKKEIADFHSDAYPYTIKAEWGFYENAGESPNFIKKRQVPQKTTGEVRVPLPGYEDAGSRVQQAASGVADTARAYVDFLKEVAALLPQLRPQFLEAERIVEFHADMARKWAEDAWKTIEEPSQNTARNVATRHWNSVEKIAKKFIADSRSLFLGENSELLRAVLERSERVVKAQEERSQRLGGMLAEKTKGLGGEQGLAKRVFNSIYVINNVAFIKEDEATDIKEDKATEDEKNLASSLEQKRTKKLNALVTGTPIEDIRQGIERLRFDPLDNKADMQAKLNAVVDALGVVPFNGVKLAGAICDVNEVFRSSRHEELTSAVAEQARKLEDRCEDYNAGVREMNSLIDRLKEQDLTAIKATLAKSPTMTWVKQVGRLPEIDVGNIDPETPV